MAIASGGENPRPQLDATTSYKSDSYKDWAAASTEVGGKVTMKVKMKAFVTLGDPRGAQGTAGYPRRSIPYRSSFFEFVDFVDCNEAMI